VTPNERIASHGDEEIDIVALCRVAWRYKYLIGAIALVGGLVAAFFAFTAVPIYRAEVVITEAREQNMGGGASLMTQIGGLANLAGVNLPGEGAGREAQAVLQSRHLIEEFIKRQNLVPVIFRGSERPPTLWAAVLRFRNDVLSIREDVRKGVTTVTIDWTDPVTAARWANDFIALANEVIRTRALSDSNRNIAYLNEQIARTRVIEMQKVMYNLIEAETKTLMLANGRAEYAFTIVDPAVPPEIRISPKRSIIVLIGLVGGLVIGLIAAFTFNRLRPGVQPGL